MVEHNVKNDFDVGAVQGFNKVAKFVYGRDYVTLRAVSRVWREPRHGLIAPIIRTIGRGLSVELLDRHEFDGLDAEVH